MGDVPVTALPETCCLYLWPGQAVYTGPALDLAPHSGSVACLVVGLDGVFTIETSEGVTPPVRTALVSPRLVHQLRAEGGRMRFCYLDGASVRLSACAALMDGGGSPVRVGHRHEESLLDAAMEPGCWLDLAAPVPVSSRVADPRVQRAARRLLDDPSLSAAEAARGCGLSTSRFLHLFSACTGTTFRRYRLWARMLLVARGIGERATLTEAAADAGFATPSHFSDAFTRMFGLRPTRLPVGEVTVMG